MTGPRILLVIGGGIAAYKSCELVRLIRKAGGEVTCVLTDGGQQFVTPMALAALSENKVYTSLFDLKDEVEMGHIQLSRQADLVVVCPATASLLAKMAAGIADDLATTLILATDKPVLAVPAMNVRMWQHQATVRNVGWLRQAGVEVMEPDEGAMACGEYGPGRLPEPPEVLRAIAKQLDLDLDLDIDTGLSTALTAAGSVAARQREAQRDDLGAEALEPEPEVESKGAWNSLLSALIPRSTTKRSHAEIDAELEALPERGPLDDPWFDSGNTEDDHAPEPDFGGPLLASKGKAAAAPLTDPAAIDFEFAGANDGAWPDPPADDGADPLAGQPDFDSDPNHRPLYGRHVLVTAGPTWERIDPIRYLANRSSGKQGFAIAAMAAGAGARVTLVAGPVHLPTPIGVDRIDVESAEEMAAEVKQALPADIAFMVAAVADWKSSHVANEKMKKRGSAPPALILSENPDILATVASGRNRPTLLIGFAAETENLLENAKSKRKRKGADWIIANNVTDTGDGGVMGGDNNQVQIVTEAGVETLEPMSKRDVARELMRRAADALAAKDDGDGDD
ncbi:peptidase [Erythrobacter sp. QSSC1-22B]|uniref:bifunctional phosphopantothenoylcysteine decarboxylase/phosphopantothenate synthase n=1 Tax=Erythrobacter sp. QSSC1-22B TaxID=1860125 RepID=UPI00080576AD|nr:bifunctional phosphopantothenoylcysteine decarboxylase/phosphopantothenate synthase [Erythrobacter sp. QSSC1-22B]OBX18779.1 peptidase [Erythrobacter sp. QSSC1-22B]